MWFVYTDRISLPFSSVAVYILRSFIYSSYFELFAVIRKLKIKCLFCPLFCVYEASRLMKYTKIQLKLDLMLLPLYSNERDNVQKKTLEDRVFDGQTWIKNRKREVTRSGDPLKEGELKDQFSKARMKKNIQAKLHITNGIISTIICPCFVRYFIRETILLFVASRENAHRHVCFGGI